MLNSNKLLEVHIYLRTELPTTLGTIILGVNKTVNEETKYNLCICQQNCQLQLMYLSTKLSIKRQNTTYSFSTNDALKHGHGVFVLL